MLRRFSVAFMLLIAFAAGVVFTQLAHRIGQPPQAPSARDGALLQEQALPDGASPQGRSYNAAPPTNTKRAPVGNPISTVVAQAATATETIPPYTGLPTLTPSRTLRPPPTLEPPTPTVPASLTPSITPTPTVELSVSIPGLRGAETPTPSTTPGCTPRKDWKLEYEVKRDDALIRIADAYNTTVEELMEANCLTNRNLIVIGQHLKVPGQAHPTQPEFQCIPFELMTPRDGTLDVPGGGNVSFVWKGPRVPYNLIRIHDINMNKVYEAVIELRQNESIDIGKAVPNAGTYIWYVYPLNGSFIQTCPEGGPWRFTKSQAPTATPTSSGGVGFP